MGDVHRTLRLLDELCRLLAAPPAFEAAASHLAKLVKDLRATALTPSGIASSSDVHEFNG